jgi:hypothetical protein
MGQSLHFEVAFALPFFILQEFLVVVVFDSQPKVMRALTATVCSSSTTGVAMLFIVGPR